MKVKEFTKNYYGNLRICDVDFPFTYMEFDLSIVPFNDISKFYSKPFSKLRNLDLCKIVHCTDFCLLYAFGVADFMQGINVAYYVAKKE